LGSSLHCIQLGDADLLSRFPSLDRTAAFWHAFTAYRMLEILHSRNHHSLELDSLIHSDPRRGPSEFADPPGVLLRIEGMQTESIDRTLIEMGVDRTFFPKKKSCPSCSIRPVIKVMERHQTACPWIRFDLSLKVNVELVGLCLLGRRDPDDENATAQYTLQALIDQTALAIMNIDRPNGYVISPKSNRTTGNRRHNWRCNCTTICSARCAVAQERARRTGQHAVSPGYDTTEVRIREIIDGQYPAY
jgi:hypothetical protein